MKTIPYIQKALLLPVMLLWYFSVSQGQQIPNFSMYNMNHYLINPAATGTKDIVPVSASFRKIWAGFNNAPSVQYLAAHMKVADDMGIGASLFNFQAGPLRKTGLEAAYSYHLTAGPETKLSFGLSLRMYQFYLNKSDMVVEHIDDEVFLGKEQMFVPDAGMGMYLYGRHYFAGISIPQLFQRNIDLKSDIILQQKQVRHYYLHGGYTFTFGSDFTLEPSALLKFMETGLLQADINALVTYKSMLNFGISFRTSDALSFQVGYKNPDLFIGYAYDLVLSEMAGNTWGSNEILFIYNFSNFLLK
jgi:type IX secretion system PorP/SprF family membrane protein